MTIIFLVQRQVIAFLREMRLIGSDGGVWVEYKVASAVGKVRLALRKKMLLF